MQPSAYFRPFGVIGKYGQNIWKVDLADEGLRTFNDLSDIIQPFHVEGVGIVYVDGAGHTPDQEIGVGIFPSENGLDFDDFFLDFERFEIVSQSHEIYFRRKFIGRVSPISVGENTEFAGLYERAYFLLYFDKITDGVFRPFR